LIDARVEHRRQVFRRVFAVAIDHAHAQVHVVFLIVVEMQPNEKIGSDLAFIAQHLYVRRDQREALIVQRVSQARLSVVVMPGILEDRVQVQHEVVGVQT
jgi:hypothetical protein